MNHRKDLANIYESTIINEIAGAINYWLLPSGELIKVHDHIYYAVENFPELEKEFYMQEDFPYNNDGSIVDEEDVYFAAGEHGYTRVVEESANIYFTYLMSVKPNKSQFTTLFNLANDKDKNLIDGETQKVIVKNNTITVVAGFH